MNTSPYKNNELINAYGEDPRELPLYGVREAAKYLKIHENTLRSWIFGRTYRLSSGEIQFAKPVIRLPHSTTRALSFMNLVEAYVLSAITRVHGVRFRKVRSALSYLEATFPSSHPLANREFWTEGFELFIEKSGDLICASLDGQMVIREVLGQYLLRIDRDLDLSAMRIYPFSREFTFKKETEHAELVLSKSPRHISIDPLVGFGRPTIAGTGIATNVIAGRFRGGETVEAIAKDYDLEAEKIQEAINYEAPNRQAA